MKQDKYQQQEDFLKLMQRYVDMKNCTNSKELDQNKLFLNTSMASGSSGAFSSSSGSSGKRSASSLVTESSKRAKTKNSNNNEFEFDSNNNECRQENFLSSYKNSMALAASNFFTNGNMPNVPLAAAAMLQTARNYQSNYFPSLVNPVQSQSHLNVAINEMMKSESISNHINIVNIWITRKWSMLINIINTIGDFCFLKASVQESSARILFLMVNWSKSNGQFKLLPINDQAYLMETNWKDLFLLSLAQWKIPVDSISDEDLLQLIGTISAQRPNRLERDHDFYVKNFKGIQDIFKRLLELNLNSIEMEFFKIILLLRNGNIFEFHHFISFQFLN